MSANLHERQTGFTLSHYVALINEEETVGANLKTQKYLKVGLPKPSSA